MVPKISVVIPVFNAARYLSAAIESVLAQSIKEVELVICDDCSTDSSVSVAARVRDDRLHILRNDRNLGPGPSRDKAIRAARAPWIAFMDADDCMRPNRLQALLGVCETERFDFVFDDLLVCHDVAGKLHGWRSIHAHAAFGGGGNIVRAVSAEEYVCSDRLLIKPVVSRAFIQNLGLQHSNRRYGEDAEFFIRLAAVGARMAYVPEAMYLYRVSEDSLTARTADKSAMRDCLEGCLEIEGLSSSLRQALETKIDRLRLNEAMYEFLRELAEMRIGRAGSVILRNPKLLWQLPKRLLRRIGYEVHRTRHVGIRR